MKDINKDNKSISNNSKPMVVNLAFSDIPQPIQRGKGGRLGNEVYTVYGANNLYPNYLLNLYSNSSIHKSIVDTKVSYILGGGLVCSDTKEPKQVVVNKAGEDIELFSRKLITDFLIFGYFAVEVSYKRDGTI